MRYLVFFLLITFLFACKNSVNSDQPSTTAKRYTLKGKVVAVDKTSKKATIDHEAVEGYMAAMTMDFPVHADWVWNDLVPGCEIRAELVVDNTAKDPYYLENVGIIAAPNPNQSPVAVNDNF